MLGTLLLLRGLGNPLLPMPPPLLGLTASPPLQILLPLLLLLGLANRPLPLPALPPLLLPVPKTPSGTTTRLFAADEGRAMNVEGASADGARAEGASTGARGGGAGGGVEEPSLVPLMVRS
mmetsp:Transcript_178163/g.571085  ORF Transcript_178163/g.571085 Transcript_178163/m.571085 type:complete len:121 (-) Transcript_178163:2744-3106(-)